MRELDAREQHVVLLRYASGPTQSQVATRIGCSQMHISRIERRALTTLRAAIDAPAEFAA